MKNKKYFLVGMPASGKSTIGRLVAGQLDLNFFDLDNIIVEQEGTTIAEIFKNKGEEYFRQLERTNLQELMKVKDGFVLATGGGAPCFFNNMELMNKHGITIFLNVEVDELFRKLSKRGIQKRPLLSDLGDDELYSELKNKLEIRRKYYAQSRICLDQGLGDITQRVNQVIFAIKTLEK